MTADRTCQDVSTAGSLKSRKAPCPTTISSRQSATRCFFFERLSQCLSPVTCVVQYLLLAVLLSTMIFSLLNYLTNTENPVSVFLHPSDEYSSQNQTNLWKTPTGVGGLELIIENALDRRWSLYLEEYVSRWSAGYDSIVPLSLRIDQIESDPSCKPSLGKLKVCNGNYGDTGWRGISIALIDDSDQFIRHSVIQLNDYYTSEIEGNPWKAIKYGDFWGKLNDESQWKYTMCHELGHGFGLPHTDENMWNRNTGECMDFTRFPRRNLSPGQHNFDRLYHLYGSVPLKRQTNLRHHVPAHRSLSQGTIAEYEKSILVALEDSSCMECRIGLSNGFQVTIHKLPLLVGMDPVKHQR